MTNHQPGPAIRSATATWYGQAGFRLASGDTRVLIDPFLTDHPERHYPPPASAADFADITLVLCTHEHLDHLDLPFLREFCAVNRTAPIVVPAPVVGLAADSGLDPARLVGATAGEKLHVAGVTVHPLPALHGMGGDQPVVYEFAPDGGPVRFLGYVMDIGGIRIYHSGDCLVYPELMAALAELAPDVLMLPINGRDHMRESEGIVGNMNETEAACLCAQVGPTYAIPMHYDAIRGNTGNPGHFAVLVHEAGGSAAIVVPRRGRTIVLALP
jgi:L-ascorbate metabolism protein UlaG (beta-lactamase superfamily)